MTKFRYRTAKAALFAIALQSAFSIPASAIDLETAIWYYESGDRVAAFLDFQILAAEGDPAAMAYMGQMYRRGHAVAQNFEQAAYWLQKGAEGGSADAHHRLGWMYARAEIGDERDMSAAVQHWKMAAEGGNTQAQMDLGVMYWRGEGIEKDLVKAYAWLTMASQNPILTAAVGNRNKMTKEMTDEQVVQGEALAKDIAVQLESAS